MGTLKNLKRSAPTLIAYLVLIVAAIYSIFPVYWTIITSLKLPIEYYRYPPVIIPSKLTLEHYYIFFSAMGGLHYLLNGLIIASGSALLSVMLALPAAYAITIHRVGGGTILYWILTQRMLPPVAALIPLFILYNQLGLIDTHIGIILTHTIFNVALCVWIIYSFLAEFPKEIIESARIDGCPEHQILWKIVVPLIKPGIAVTTLFAFVGSWNELMLVVTLARRAARTPMVLLASQLQAPTTFAYGAASAIGVVAMLPAVILAIFSQRYLIRGLTMGALRG